MMNERKQRGTLGLTLVMLGLGLGGMSQIERFAPQWSPVVFWGSLAVIVAGLILIVMSQLSFATDAGKDLLQRLKEGQDFDLTIRTCKPSEVSSLIEFGESHVGQVLPHSEDLTRRLERNPSCVTCFMKKVDGRESGFLGYYVIYPLNSNAHDLIQKGVIVNGTYLLPEHLSKNGRRATAYYIGMLLGTSVSIRAIVLQHLREELRSLLKRNRRAVALYAKPATAVGERYLNRWGFTPMSPKSEIWYRGVDRELIERLGAQRAASR